MVNLLLNRMLKFTCRKMKGNRLYSLHVKKSTSHGQCIALICSSVLPQKSVYIANMVNVSWSFCIISISYTNQLLENILDSYLRIIAS